MKARRSSVSTQDKIRQARIAFADGDRQRRLGLPPAIIEIGGLPAAMDTFAGVQHGSNFPSEKWADRNSRCAAPSPKVGSVLDGKISRRLK